MMFVNTATQPEEMMDVRNAFFMILACAFWPAIIAGFVLQNLWPLGIWTAATLIICTVFTSRKPQ